MPIDPRMVKWDEAPALDASKVQWDDAPTAPAKPLSRLDKIGRGIMDPIDGGAQLLANALPRGLVEAGNRANNWLAENTGLVAPLPKGGVDQQVREKLTDYEARRAASGETGFDGYRALGGFAATLPLALATGGTGATAGLAGRVGMGAAQGGAASALNPVTGNGDYWTEKGTQVAVGAGLGGGLAAGLGGLARVISPNASRNPQLALLRKEGVTPSIGQALGGFANRLEERGMSLPLAGDAIRSARDTANNKLREATFNRALAPIGEKLPTGLSGREAVDYTEGMLQQRYGDVLAKIGAIPADQQFASKLSSLGSMVNRDFLSPDAKAKFGNILGGVQSMFGRSGALTSEGFKRIESQLGTDFRTLSAAQDVYDNRLASAVKQLQQELRDLLKRQAGPHADELQAANTGWANFKRAQNAAGRVGAEDGNFTPAQFQSAVRALDKSKDKGAFARGSALGQDLGDAGKNILGNKVPNSGTADRSLLAAALLNPSLLLAPLAGAGAYTQFGQRALVGAAASRPQAAQGAAEALRKASPMLIPGLSQLPLY